MILSFAVPNLYITDGSVLPTQGSANPAPTIMAVATRADDPHRPPTFVIVDLTNL